MKKKINDYCLLPVLAKLNLTDCNFGPTLTVVEIIEHMPRTRIDGQLAPFTFMRNDEDQIINDVSLLTSMRAVMYAIQTYGRY